MTDANTSNRKPLSERLNAVVAQRRDDHPVQLKTEFDIRAWIRYWWRNIDMDVGGWLDLQWSDMEINAIPRFRLTYIPVWEFSENRRAGEKANPADPIVHETESLGGYLTVNYQNGNYEWFEYNFRVRDGVAYLGSATRIERVSNSGSWVPSEVEKAIHIHHPKIEVTSDAPPWWE